MTTQLEKELTALFHDAASRVEVRPTLVRSPRRTAVNRALATGLAAALAAGVVLVATRLGSDAANRGGAITPASTQQLVDAVARTLGQPIRLVTTISPEIAPAQHSATETVTEMDINQRMLVTFRNGEPQMLVHGDHLYEGISDFQRQTLQLPSSAQWIQLGSSPEQAQSMMQTVGGVLDVGQLTEAIRSGQVTVTEVGRNTYRLSGHDTMSSPAPTTAGSETIHVSKDGLLDWAKLRMDLSSGSVRHVDITVRVRPLGHPVRARLPDPDTVISQEAFQSASTQGNGQSCSSTPASPAVKTGDSAMYSSELTCTFSGRVTGTRSVAHPKRHGTAAGR